MGHLGSPWSSSAPGEPSRRFAWSSTGSDRSIQIVLPSWDCAQGTAQPGNLQLLRQGSLWNEMHSCPSCPSKVHPYSGIVHTGIINSQGVLCSVQGESVADSKQPQEFPLSIVCLKISWGGKCFALPWHKRSKKNPLTASFATNFVRAIDFHHLFPTSSHYPPTLQGLSADILLKDS